MSSNNVKIGIAVSTFTEEGTEDKRYEIIDKSLQSLYNTLKTTDTQVYVVVVIDGNVPDKHRQILDKYAFKTYQRSSNGGVARTKNTCIRLLMEQRIDIGFLVDDDLLYNNNCFDVYTRLITKTKCHHIIACYPHPKVHPDWNKLNYVLDTYHEEKIRKHGGETGYFLSFTPELINTIGYFRVLPGKFGSEHINFSNRVLSMGMAEFHFDIDESIRYVEHIGFWPIAENLYGKCHSISQHSQQHSSKINNRYVNIDLDKKIELVE